MSSHFYDTRRRFIKTSILGGLGLAQGLDLSGPVRAQNSSPPSTIPIPAPAPPARVAMTTGNDRADNTFRALRTFENVDRLLVWQKPLQIA